MCVSTFIVKMASGEEKPWKTQSERKAYFTGLEKGKAAHAAKNWYASIPMDTLGLLINNRSSYVQGHWQSTGPSLPTNHWQPWPSHPPTHPMGQSQSPGWNQWQASSTQGTSQTPMQPQPPVLNQQQAINEFHRLHQYNTEQSFNHLRSLLTGQPVPPSPQYQHCPAPGPFVPFQPPQNMRQPYNMGQALGAFGFIPKSQTSQTPASKSPFKPDSVRCEEVDDTSTSTSSVLEPSETPVSSVATIDKIPEPDRKRKSETEIVETIKRTRVESTAEAEAPTASNKDLIKMNTELDRPHEIELVLPQAYRNPSVDDASPNNHGPSQQSYNPHMELTIGDANAPTPSKADAMALDPSKTPPMTSHRTTLHQGTKSRITPGDLENSSTVVEQQLLAEVLNAVETSSQASTPCLSPELPYHSLPFKASKSICKSEHPPDSLLHSSLDDLPDLDISARDTAPPNSPRDYSFLHEAPDAIPKSLRRNQARDQHIASHERLAAPEKRTFRMLLELEFTLKVAQVEPMARAKPKYDSCYHTALQGLEDGDIHADSSEDSEYINDSGDDEDEDSVTLDNIAEYSDDEELDNDAVKPRSMNLTPNTTAGKASAKPKMCTSSSREKRKGSANTARKSKGQISAELLVRSLNFTWLSPLLLPDMIKKHAAQEVVNSYGIEILMQHAYASIPHVRLPPNPYVYPSSPDPYFFL